MIFEVFCYKKIIEINQKKKYKRRNLQKRQNLYDFDVYISVI